MYALSCCDFSCVDKDFLNCWVSISSKPSLCELAIVGWLWGILQPCALGYVQPPFLMDFTLWQHAGSMIEGSDPVTGHIISTTIGGKNGEPKRVIFRGPKVTWHYWLMHTAFFPNLGWVLFCFLDYQLHGRESCGNWIIRNRLPGKVTIALL